MQKWKENLKKGIFSWEYIEYFLFGSGLSGLGNKAVILTEFQQFEEAMVVIFEQEKISREIGNKESLGRSLFTQAIIEFRI